MPRTLRGESIPSLLQLTIHSAFQSTSGRVWH
jgi:hypothetical protein